MALYSGFFGAENETEYTQPQFAAVFAKLFSNGVTVDFENEFEVVENSPVSLSVVVKSGWLWINGFWCYNSTDIVKSLAAADPDNPRIDRIVARLDTTDDLEISIEVLEGTPGADPDPPELTEEDATYEIPAAQVLVGTGVDSVSNANITDEREYAAIPGVASDADLATQKVELKANEIIIMAGGFKINGSACELVPTEGTAAKCYAEHLAVAKTEWFDILKFRIPDDYDGGDITISVCFRSAGAAKTHSLGIRVASVATGEVHNPDLAAAYQLYNAEASDAVAGKTTIKTVTVTQANHLMAAGEIWHCKCVMEDDVECDADDVLIDWIAIEWNKG